MSLGHAFKLSIQGCTTSLYVVRVEGTERVHAPHRFAITVRVDEGASLDAEAVIGERASLTLAHGGDVREIAGIVDEIEEIGTGYCVRLASRVAMLDDAVGHRVFLDQDAATIAESVLQVPQDALTGEDAADEGEVALERLHALRAFRERPREPLLNFDPVLAEHTLRDRSGVLFEADAMVAPVAKCRHA